MNPRRLSVRDYPSRITLTSCPRVVSAYSLASNLVGLGLPVAQISLASLAYLERGLVAHSRQVSPRYFSPLFLALVTLTQYATCVAYPCPCKVGGVSCCHVSSLLVYVEPLL